MSLLSENVMPGNHGRVFATNAKSESRLKEIKSKIMEINGIKDVVVNMEVFPRELTIHTSTIVSIIEIEEAVKKIGFHAIPKSLFLL